MFFNYVNSQYDSRKNNKIIKPSQTETDEKLYTYGSR